MMSSDYCLVDDENNSTQRAYHFVVICFLQEHVFFILIIGQ